MDIWNLKTKSHQDTIRVGNCDIAISVTLSQDGELMILNTGIGRITFNRNTNGYHSFTKSLKGLQLWNLTTGNEIQGPWQRHAGIVAFSPYNNFLAVLDGEDINTWHIKTGVKIFNITYSEIPNFSGMIDSRVIVSPDGTMLASIHNERSQRGMLQVWDINNREQLHIPSSEKVLTVAFSPNKPLLAVATLNGTKLYNLDNNGEFNDISLDNLKVRGNTLKFSPNGNFLLGGNRNSGINLWNVYTGKKILEQSGHTNDIETIMFSDDGKMLASGSRDGTILLWDWEEITMKIKQNKDMDDGE